MASPALTLVEREWFVYRKLWHASVFSSFVLPALFLAAMGLGLGGLVDDRPGDVGGFTYLQFLAPGLLVNHTLQEMAFGSMWPVLGGKKWDRRYFGQVAAPASAVDVYRAHLLWLGLRSAVTGAWFLLVAWAMGGLVSPWAVLALPATLLCGSAMASVVAAWAVGRDTELPFTAVMRLAVTPLMLFSGTFFPISTLPDAIEPLAWLSPLWHGAELARAATTGSFAAVDLAHVGILAGLLAVGLAWGRRTFPRELTP